ncbi:hypothetical protein SEF58_03075 [Neomoorella humiferrea]|uniref:hypothetical protein n=1 Tax=Neomoorella humiferrea TaxID=676965 RepID=UPI003D8AFBC2
MLPVRVFAVFPFLIVLFFVITGLFQWLWNITMPEVFNLKKITFWQALRLLIIAGLLFGGNHFTWR